MESLWEVLQDTQSTLDLPSLAKRIKESKSQINKKNGQGMTALHLAAANGNVDAVSILLQNGANPNQVDRVKGRTSCHWAAFGRHIRALVALVHGGGSMLAVDREGKTPHDYVGLYVRSLGRGEEKGEENRELYTWGLGHNFQLGTGFADDKQNPCRVKAMENKRISAVTCSKFHTATLTDDGQVWTCGFGRGGRLGHGDEESRLVPTQIMGFASNRVTMVSASQTHTACITEEGALYTFGIGELGQLGLGPQTLVSLVPKKVKVPLEKKFVTRVATSKNHTACLTADRELYTFGFGGDGALGYDVAKSGEVSAQFFPRVVSSFMGSNVTNFAVGTRHTAIVVDHSEVFCVGFGRSYSKRVALGTKAYKPKVLDITANGSRTAATTSEGVLCWSGDGTERGSGSKPKLVIGDGVTKVSMGGRRLVVVKDGGAFEWSESSGLTRLDMHRVVDVAVSKIHTAVVISVPTSFGLELSAVEELSNDLGKFVGSEMYSDFSFVLDSKQRIPIHKVILAARCKHFKFFFQREDANELVLQGTSEVALKSVLQYIYTNTVDFPTTSEDHNLAMKLCQQWKLSQLQSIASAAKRSKRRSTGSTYQEDLKWALSDEAQFLSDVTIVVESENIPAHKVILGARCGFFAACLTSGMREVQDSQVKIGDIHHTIMRKVLHHIYTGDIPKIASQNVLDIMAAADRFFLQGLKNVMIHKLCTMVDLSSVSNFLEIAELYEAPALRNTCLDFVLHNFSAVMDSGQMSAMDREVISDLENELKKVPQLVEEETEPNLQFEMTFEGSGSWEGEDVKKPRKLATSQEKKEPAQQQSSDSQEKQKKGKRRSKKLSQSPVAPVIPPEKPEEKTEVLSETPPETQVSSWPGSEQSKLSWGVNRVSPCQVSLLKIQEEEVATRKEVTPPKKTVKATTGISEKAAVSMSNGWKVTYKGKAQKEPVKATKQPAGPAWACPVAASPPLRSLLEIQAEEQNTTTLPLAIFTPPKQSTSPTVSPMKPNYVSKRDDRLAWSSPPRDPSVGNGRQKTKRPEGKSPSKKSLNIIQKEERLLAELKAIYGENVTEALAEMNLGLEALLE